MKKIRPAVIVNDNQLGKLPLKIIAPITDWKEHYSVAQWMIAIAPSNQNGLTKNLQLTVFKYVQYQKIVL